MKNLYYVALVVACCASCFIAGTQFPTSPNETKPVEDHIGCIVTLSVDPSLSSSATSIRSYNETYGARIDYRFKNPDDVKRCQNALLDFLFDEHMKSTR